MKELEWYQLNVSELEQEDIFQKYYEEMSETRRKKIDKIRVADGKRLSLGAGIILDKGLRKFGLREKDVRIAEGENGKPYLLDYPEIHFNLSHSGNMVAATFANVEVGCDIERVEKIRLEIAKRFFCPSEYEHIVAQESEEHQKEEFYRLWTLKESFMKVTGLGMQIPLNEFCFEFGEKITVRQNVDQAEYEFLERQLIENGELYRIAICSRAE